MLPVFIAFAVIGILLFFVGLYLLLNKKKPPIGSAYSEPAADVYVDPQPDVEATKDRKSAHISAGYDIQAASGQDFEEGLTFTNLDRRIVNFIENFPENVTMETNIPVLNFEEDWLGLANEFYHFRAGCIFYEAELETPVFEIRGGLTEDNQKIFKRCLIEVGVGVFYITTGKLVFRNNIDTLMINIKNVEDYTVFEDHLVIKELGIPKMSVFFTRQAKQASEIIKILFKRQKIILPRIRNTDV
ncbi:MAG: hypothetical protein KAR07_06315 [Spirochaetes bacterium]|nr:hypothetical protein [Spirochaetota bacterium]